MAEGRKRRTFADVFTAQPPNLRSVPALVNQTPPATESAHAILAPAAIESEAAPASESPRPLPLSPADSQSAPVKLSHPEQHTRYPNELLDTILPTLTPNEQVILIRLYRWTRGFQRAVCKTSNVKIAKACHISDRTVIRVLPILEARALIKRGEIDYSNPNQSDRGFTIEVLLPAAARVIESPPDNQAAGDRKSHIERNTRKEILERGGPSLRDLKDCPDCRGTGYWYPEGIEKGVAKCKHERMEKR
jgi:hypothetical protein